MGLAETRAASYASSINAADLGQLLPKHASYGQQHFKLKIGLDTDNDLAFVRQAAALKPAGTWLMIDSNQSWDLQQSVQVLQVLEEFELLFAEETLCADADFVQWEELARSTSIPLAGGENIYGVANFLRMADAGMQYLQPDVAKWGGVSGALELAKSLPGGVKLWPHFMGTAIGQVAALSVAAAVGGESVCEMDVNKNALRTGLCGDVLTIEGGYIALPEAPGLVVPPLEASLSEYLEAG